jgi:cellulose synthase/poly-beta-1,6-N-acetylglucosamine synthase-like glycosyltransferase
MTISTDFLTFFFLFYCVLYNIFLCLYFLISQLPFRQRNGAGRGTNAVKDMPILTVMIPALNEEKVLEETILRLLALPYPGRLEILIIDDNSDDSTPLIAERLGATYENVHLLQRNSNRSQQGKGDVLNHGFSHLRASFPKRNPENWVIGIFDADGRAVEDDMFVEIGRTFADGSIAAAQCGVRIRNGHNLLAALQDVEFATFSFITQTVRDRTSGAVALGGNGQFVRAAILNRLSQEGECWNDSALTEDLDIGIRIHLHGGRIRFVNRWVEQEGVETFKALFKQRHRWAWGTLQVFLKHLLSGRIFMARISLAKKLDLHYYLSFWIVPFIVLFSFLLSLLNLTGALKITNSFGSAFLLANSFSFVPMMTLGLAWARVPIYKIVYLVPLTVIYAYHWIPALILGWASILSHRKPQWVKTKRFVVVAEEVVK